ncbi:helix-turn-helix transcriptional regulator [Hydrogenibacillus schlegelii]|nr:WYL domain-containing protein [Hydrogenibacillus schlegelii]
MRTRRSQRYRLLRLLMLLRTGRAPSARQLADMLEISLRTVRRDLDELRDDWGAPIEFDRRRGGYVLTDPNWQPPIGPFTELRLSAGEAVALLLAHTAFEAMRGTGLEDAFRSLVAKLPAWLPESVSVNPEELRAMFSFAFEPLRGDAREVAERLHALRQAIDGRRHIVLEYASASRGEVTRREVEPYHLRYFDGAWYVVGFCRLRQDLRIFAVDRIRAIEPTGRTFAPPDPERFSPETYFAATWRLERGEKMVRVAVRFTPEQARYMRGRRWHPSQEAVEEPDGSLVLLFRVLGLEEIKRWIMQFGAAAEVLEPPELRDKIVAEAEKIIARSRVSRSVTLDGVKKG